MKINKKKKNGIGNGIKNIFRKKEQKKPSTPKISKEFYLFEYAPIIESRIEEPNEYGMRSPMLIKGNALDANIVFSNKGKPSKEKCYDFRCWSCTEKLYELKKDAEIKSEADNVLETIKEHSELGCYRGGQKNYK